MNDVLVVDDSALMRRLICDIINSVQGFTASDTASNAQNAMMRIRSHSYFCICYNVCMTADAAGPDIFTLMKDEGVNIPVIGMCYPMDIEKAKAMKGPAEIVVHPYRMSNDTDSFAAQLADALVKVRPVPQREFRQGKQGSDSKEPRAAYSPKGIIVPEGGEIPVSKRGEIRNNYRGKYAKYPFQLVAIASSTGGPQALHTVIPGIPKGFPVPIVIVQHMPRGFTDSLAKRISDMSEITMKEAVDGEILREGTAYIAPGGKQFEVHEDGAGNFKAKVYDAPPVNNLRPCADVMYESLKYISAQNILCTVLTGMGSDGTEGIRSLKKEKHLYVISQDQSTCVVYGMPKAVYAAGLSDEQQPIGSIAKAISRKLGV